MPNCGLTDGSAGPVEEKALYRDPGVGGEEKGPRAAAHSALSTVRGLSLLLLMPRSRSLPHPDATNNSAATRRRKARLMDLREKAREPATGGWPAPGEIGTTRGTYFLVSPPPPAAGGLVVGVPVPQPTLLTTNRPASRSKAISFFTTSILS